MTLILAGEAAAQTEIVEPDRVVVRRTTTVDFNEVAIGGELAGPQGSMVMTRRASVFKSMVPRRGDFLPELQRMSRSTDALSSLIEQRLRPGADVEAIDRRIHAMFGERWCVVFTDMAGFSRRSARDGIVSFLVLIHQMDRICMPIVMEHAGLVLKRVADFHVILFRDPRAALRACVDMQRRLQQHNAQAHAQDQLFTGCGMGWGDVLKLGDDDVYGVEVNFAAKLGEDLAEPYQILLTPAAARAVNRKVAGVKVRKVPGGRLGGTGVPYFEAVFLPPDRKLEKGKRAARRLVEGSSGPRRGRR